MRPIRRILVATDFSSEAATALQTAASLLGSGREDAEIILLHSYLVPYDLLPADGFVSAAAGLKQWQTAQIDVERRLALCAQTLPESAPTVVTRGVEGYPPDIIVEQAALHDVDLIAMGTHGRTGLSHAFLGSIAEKVIHRAPCPVLTVRCDPTLERKGGPHARRQAEEIPQ
jgi:nucleotide-binding universal stress UspA family protein